MAKDPSHGKPTREQVAATWGVHPARRIGFDELYDGLMEHVRERRVTRVVSGDLELFNYSVKAYHNVPWDVFSLISRGLILRPGAREVVATPFPKFFNLGEAESWGSESFGPVSVTTKYDGALGIVYHDGARWRVATRGSFESEPAEWAERVWNESVDLRHASPGVTYLVEIVHQTSRGVVNYPFESLVLLGAYLEDGSEVPASEVAPLAEELGLRSAERHAFRSLDHLAESAGSLGLDAEGWVVRFANGHRLKIKGDEYCRVHRLITSVTPLGVWRWLRAGENLDTIRADIPEEHRRDFDQLRSMLTSKVERILADVEEGLRKAEAIDNAALGRIVGDGRWPDGTPLADAHRRYLFVARKGGFAEAFSEVDSRIRRSIFDSIRPDDNNLPGYEASRARTRFADDA